MKTRFEYVYTVALCGTNIIKIGQTKTLMQRMSQLKCGSTTELLAIIITDDSREVEAELHDSYSEFRIPQTEYFNLPYDPRKRSWITGEADKLFFAPINSDSSNYQIVKNVAELAFKKFYFQGDLWQ